MRAAWAGDRVETALRLVSRDADTLERFDVLLLDLETVTAPAGGDWTRARTQAACDIARRFIGTASQAGLPDLDAAARSLCQVANDMIACDRHEPEPIRAHAEAMRLLRLPEALGRNLPELLDGLRLVREGFMGPAARQAPVSAR